MLNTQFSPWPCFTEEEAEAVKRVLLSNEVNYWTGNECREFEKEFAAWVAVEYAVALANGTVALEVALKALGIGPGDEVIVTPRSFLASASCVIMAGAIPVFADVDCDSQNITAETIAAVLTKKTKAIIVVHLAGWPCELGPIMKLAAKHNFKVIEDCAQAHGAQYNNRSVGSIGDIGVWSFCQDKIITTGGEGGMVTTNDPVLWQKMWSYKDHGKSFSAVYEKQHPPGFRWLHESFGSNYRLTEMQAAIGRIQLGRMPQWHTARAANADRIWRAAMEIPALRVPAFADHVRHAAYKCYIFVEPEKLAAGWDRDRIMHQILQHGVPCYSGSCSEVYLEKAFDGLPYQPKTRLPIAKKLGETSLMFLVHPTLTKNEIEKTCNVLIEVMRQASR